MPNNPSSYALFDCNGSTLHRIFLLFSSFSFLFSGHLLSPGLYMHPMLFLFRFFSFLLSIVLYVWFNFLQMESMVKALSPIAIRLFSSPSRITSSSLGKLLRTWIRKSSFDTLPFWPNLFIGILSLSKWEIYLSGSLWINSNLLLWNSLFNFSTFTAYLWSGL